MSPIFIIFASAIIIGTSLALVILSNKKGRRR